MKVTQRSVALVLGAVLTATTATVWAGGGVGPGAGVGGGRGPGGLLAGFDANDDGSLTAAELTAGAAAAAQERLGLFLDRYDVVPAGQTGGDGSVTTAEARAVFEAQALDWVEHVLETHDANDDGTLSEAEQPSRRGGRGIGHLDAYDANDDGAVTTAELTAAAAERTAERLAVFLARYDSVPTGATAGDGTVTSAEALAVFTAEIGERVSEFLETFDGNDDGSVTAAEIAAVQGVRARGKGGRGGR